MGEKTAEEWVGKKATINKVLHFPYYDIPSYKDVFKNSYCNYTVTGSKWIDPAEFEREYKLSMGVMGVKTNLLLVIETGCTETPFQSIIVNDENEIIVYWDGMFFYLKRE